LDCPHQLSRPAWLSRILNDISLTISTIIIMSKYSGTQTEKNLWAAFAGESQARNKYTYFASKAKKEGFEQIAAIFE